MPRKRIRAAKSQAAAMKAMHKPPPAPPSAPPTTPMPSSTMTPTGMQFHVEPRTSIRRV